MLRSAVSPTAHHATRFASLFLRSTKVPPNTETVLALRSCPGDPHQGRLNLWLCLVLNTQGLTHPLPSPHVFSPSPLFESQFVQPTPSVLEILFVFFCLANSPHPPLRAHQLLTNRRFSCSQAHRVKPFWIVGCAIRVTRIAQGCHRLRQRCGCCTSRSPRAPPSSSTLGSCTSPLFGYLCRHPLPLAPFLDTLH